MKKTDQLTGPSPVKTPAPEHDEYQVKSAMDDLIRAEEHKQNPKLMAAIHSHAKKKAKAINSIAGLREKRQELLAKKNAPEAETPAETKAEKGIEE